MADDLNDFAFPLGVGGVPGLPGKQQSSYDQDGCSQVKLDPYSTAAGFEDGGRALRQGGQARSESSPRKEHILSTLDSSPGASSWSSTYRTVRQYMLFRSLKVWKLFPQQ
jgi:hypothetical protein